MVNWAYRPWSTLSGCGSNDNLTFRAPTIVFQSAWFFFSWYHKGSFLVPQLGRKWNWGGEASLGWASWHLQVGKGTLLATGTKSTSCARHCGQATRPSQCVSLGKVSLMTSREWECFPWPIIVSGVPGQFPLPEPPDLLGVGGREWAYCITFCC